MRRDLIYAVRVLLRHPGFALAVVLTLAVGVGANAAVFSVLDAVLLQPLPFADPDRVVVLEVEIEGQTGPPGPVAAAEYLDYRDRCRTFERLAAFQTAHVPVSARQQARRVVQARVSAALFPLLDVRPALGRLFSADEDLAGRDDVVVLSHGLWRTLFEGSPHAVGEALMLDGRPRTVVGIMPAGFVFPTPGLRYAEPADLWVPFAVSAEEMAGRGNAYHTAVVGRLRSGATLAEAQADTQTVARDFMREHPHRYSRVRVTPVVRTLGDRAVGERRRSLELLAAAVFMVFLIACANVANLALVHVSGRAPELSVRRALGATGGRIVRQLAAQGLVLALLAAGGAVLVAWIGVRIVRVVGPDDIPRLGDATLNVRVLGVTLLLAVCASLAATLVPAVTAGRRLSLPRGVAAGGEQGARLRGALIVFETALALALVISAGLLANSLTRVLLVDPGFHPEGASTFRVALPAFRYDSAPKRQDVVRNLLERLRQTPGATAAAATHLPLTRGWAMAFSVEGGDPTKLNIVSATAVSAGYFRAMGIPVREGRDFRDADTLEGPGVVVVSQSLADRFWPGQSAIGRRTQWGPLRAGRPWLTVVGVVADVRASAVDVEPAPLVYLPLAQYPQPFSPAFIVRGAAAGTEPLSAARDAVAAVDPELPVYDARPLREVVDRSTHQRRFAAYLVAAFGVAALTLAAIGLFGVISHHVALRSREFGIRLALGAGGRAIIVTVVGRGLRLALAGIAAGICLAAAGTRYLASSLYGIGTLDPLTVAASLVLLVAVSLAACYLPARRALGVDPATVLRSDS